MKKRSTSALIASLIGGALIAMLLLSSLTAEEGDVSLYAVGDILPPCETSCKGPGASPFQHVLPLLLSSDILFGNLEAPLLDDGAPAEGQIIHQKGPPGFSSELAAAHFRVISLANNHMLDYGPNGMDSTVNALDGVDVGSVGLKGRVPLTITMHGVPVTFLAATAGYHPFNNTEKFPLCSASIDRLEREVRHFASLGHRVVVSLHWGEEDSDTPSDEQRNAAYRLVDAGASLILGHHPHVLQGMERRGKAVIAYSLGNFLWPGAEGCRAESGILHVQIGRIGVTGCEVIPTELQEGFPTPAEGERRSDILLRLLLLCRELGQTDAEISGTHLIIPLIAEKFRSGERIALDDDGREWARLAGGTITVFRSSSQCPSLLWQSPQDRYIEKAVTASCFGKRRQLVMLVRTLTAEKHWKDDHWEFSPGARDLTQHLWVVGTGSGSGAWRSLWMSSALDRAIVDITVKEDGGTVLLQTVEKDREEGRSEPEEKTSGETVGIERQSSPGRVLINRSSSSGSGISTSNDGREERLYVWTGWAFQEYEDPSFTRQRYRMVQNILAPSGISDDAVLMAACTIPRHLFVPEPVRASAYENKILPIGCSQTIPEPAFMARLAQWLHLSGNEKVLEIGTGSGYEAALLSRCCKEVFTVEIVSELGARAERTWHRLFLDNIRLRIGDGSQGWPDCGPYDAIIVTAAPPGIPRVLIDQLADEGTMLIACGTPDESKSLYRVTKAKGKLSYEYLGSVIMAPMEITDPGLEMVKPPASCSEENRH